MLLTPSRYLGSTSVRQFWRAQCVPFDDEFGKLERQFQHHLSVIQHSSQAEQLNLIQKINQDADEELHRVRQRDKSKLYYLSILMTSPPLNTTDIAEERKSCLNWISKHDCENEHDTILFKRYLGTGNWLIEHHKFQEWLSSLTFTILWCFGKRKHP